MCLGCGTDSCGYAVANMLYVFEKIASCFAATSVVVCLVVTLMTMLGLGVGLGYNYCVVDYKVNTTPSPDETVEDDNRGKSGGAQGGRKPAGGGKGRRKRDFNELPSRAARAPPAPASVSSQLPSAEDVPAQSTLVVPLHKYDFHSLVATLRKNNRNVTLELIT